MQGWADDVDLGRKTVTVAESVLDPQQGEAIAEDSREDHSSGEVKSEEKGLRKRGKRFEVPYDKLVVTVGCYSQTFGTKGVKENAFFMKDVGDARRIRKRLLECFEIANLPTTSEKLRKCTNRSRSLNRAPALGNMFSCCRQCLMVESARKTCLAIQRSHAYSELCR